MIRADGVQGPPCLYPSLIILRSYLSPWASSGPCTSKKSLSSGPGSRLWCLAFMQMLTGLSPVTVDMTVHNPKSICHHCAMTCFREDPVIEDTHLNPCTHQALKMESGLQGSLRLLEHFGCSRTFCVEQHQRVSRQVDTPLPAVAEMQKPNQATRGEKRKQQL